MKRKSKVLNDEKFTKKRRLEAVKEEEDGREDHGTSFNDHSTSPSGLGDIGVIESITIKNFMCHHLLGPFQFGPNVNFIVGNNGSGKSAILTALIVGLGGKATITNRGASLKGFVKNGESTADVTVKLRNRGPDAYKGDVYGECISIEQRISSDGVRTCRLKSKTGHLVSNKKDELTAILDHFNIQVDNPVSILNQEMSKQFLHSKSEGDKYKFFMKATLLEQMKRDYIHIKQTKAVTREQVERQEECLKDLKQEFLQKKERYENLSSVGKMKETLEELKKMMAWGLVREKERLVQQLQEQIDAEESNHKHEENLQLCQNKVTVAEKKLQEIQSRLHSRKEEEESLSEDCRKIKEEVKSKNKAQKEQEVVYFRAVNKLKQSEKEQSLLHERIHKVKNIGSQNKKAEAEHTKRLQKISSLRALLEKHETQCTALNQEIKDRQQALFKGKEELDKLRLEEKNIQVSMEAKLKRKNQLLASRSNKLKRFGDNMPDLLDNIDKAYIQGRFTKKPLGPIGACINLKDPALAVAVESCLRSFMKTFCCDNYKDEAVLQDLMSRYFSKGNRPQIIVSPFSGSVYKVQGRGVNHPDYPSVLDSLSIANPVIANCLIDMRGIESILIIKEKNAARRVMQQGRPPRNCREAFTVEGDQVYPNRYYTPDFSMAKYLGGDLETEIRMVESELENYKAQLSRFQLHLSSVNDDIQRMEAKLHSTIMTLKKTLATVNQVKAGVTELENVEEEQTDDISTLEEVAQENQQRIDGEKKTVEEAKEELEEHKRTAKEVDCQYVDVRNRIEQLAEETEPLKEEQGKAEAQCSKLERSLKILEKKLKDHQDNMQAMRSDLALKEEEVTEFVAKAKEISPERQQVDRSARSIDVEITRLRRKISVQESSHGDHEQVVREYAEALANYRDKSNQVRDLKKFIDRLDNIMSDRQTRYKIMRRSLSVRCKLYFNNFLIKMNCCGSMMFDHNSETLSISVKPPGRENDSMSDMRSLSGGERSFSTVCFILSLWEITESPFRCLDEFDVYMDMHNRRISLDLLLELSERQHLRQFFFITPLSTSNLPKSDHIKIHQLQDPERTGGHTGDEDLG
ncbi:structural maintenance of chromosomes protein 6 [Oncorhynchus kisutch]|uniref:Structural maintenance of chromosomes protein 6 n=1 Tax=Oncorhynchus kisutch TaxID=8019 RepID=A0A8C7HHU5_ONCKI|nr:structural maintenance of chromosomes protein 6 [Oncorhynchus kisutch]XP_020357158.2 structural maintenance of chromosomes protein 6 [Oncorhynchus kisutch]XP_020357159.2 structural maintenance of chromosomes protein 6 [Oncorhynchus kisutch]